MPANPCRSLRWTLPCLAFAVVLATGSANAMDPNTLTADELAEGWILLFDGKRNIRIMPVTKDKIIYAIIYKNDGIETIV